MIKFQRKVFIDCVDFYLLRESIPGEVIDIVF